MTPERVGAISPGDTPLVALPFATHAAHRRVEATRELTGRSVSDHRDARREVPSHCDRQRARAVPSIVPEDELNRDISRLEPSPAGDRDVWELAPRRLEAEFPAYHADSQRMSSDPVTLELDVPTRPGRLTNHEFEPAFGLDVTNADMALADGWIGLLIIPVLGLLSLLLGGIRWLFRVIWHRRKPRQGAVGLGITTVTLSDEGLTCKSYDGTAHHVQWTLIDSVWVSRTPEGSLQIAWRLKSTGGTHVAEIGPGVERGLLASRVAMYAGQLYRSPWSAPVPLNIEADPVEPPGAPNEEPSPPGRSPGHPVGDMEGENPGSRRRPTHAPRRAFIEPPAIADKS